VITKHEKVELEAERARQDLAASIARSQTPERQAISAITMRALRYFSNRNETVTACELAAFLRCVESAAQCHCDVLLENQFIYTNGIDPGDARYNEFGSANLGYRITTSGRKLVGST
jgi:hypothetical protein